VLVVEQAAITQLEVLETHHLQAHPKEQMALVA
jgi:hypothetical protein